MPTDERPACRICGTPLRAGEQQPTSDCCPHGWSITPLFPMPRPALNTALRLTIGEPEEDTDTRACAGCGQIEDHGAGCFVLGGRR